MYILNGRSILISIIDTILYFKHLNLMKKENIRNLVDQGSYMSAHALLNLLEEFGKRDKMSGFPSILSFFPNEFKNSLTQEQVRFHFS